MSARVRAWERAWLREAPLVDLAVLRVAAVGGQLAWMLSGALAAGLRPDADGGATVLLARLFDGASTPAALAWAQAVTLASGALALVGLATRASLALFAFGTLHLGAQDAAAGSWHHHSAALAIVLVALALSPAGGALSVDARLAAARGRPFPATSAFARWPVLLARWTLALVFLSAALSKLGRAGLEWTNGATLQYVAFVKGAKLERPFGVWLSRQHELCRALSWGVLAFEASFFLAVVRPALARVYVPMALAFLAGVELALGASFPQLAALCAAFPPWSRWIARLRR